MAKYFLYVKVFSRGKGSRVTRPAAYRAGERIRENLTLCLSESPRTLLRCPSRGQLVCCNRTESTAA